MSSDGPSFFRRRGLMILVLTMFLLPFIGLGSWRALLSNRNDVKSWLPAAYEETKTFVWYWKHFEGDAFIMASWEGCDLGNETVANVANKLRKHNLAEEAAGRPRLFRDVTPGEEGLNRRINEQGVPRDEALARLQGSIIGPDGKQTCILVTISPKEILAWDKLHPAGQQLRSTIFHAAVRRVYETAADFGVTRNELHLGGPPVDNVSIDIEGEQSLATLTVVCSVLAIGLSWWTLRSWRFTAIVLTTGVLAEGVALALVNLVGTPMNAILMTMPMLVFVAAVSGAIHLSNYYRDSVATGGVEGAADRAVKHAWLPLALATGTTGIGLASLAVSELVPIQTFGIFAALGVAGSFVVLCTYTPSLLDMWRPRQRGGEHLSGALENSLWSRYGVHVARWILRHNVLVVTGCLVLLAVGLYGVNQVETSVKLMRLFSKNAKIRQDYAWLEEHLGRLVPIEIIVRIDESKKRMNLAKQMRLVEEIRRAVEDMPDVGNALAAPTFAPPTPTDPLGKATFGVVLRRKRAALHDYWCQSQDGKEQLWRISARVSALDDKLDYKAFVDSVRSVVEPMLAAHRENGDKGISAVYTGVIPLVDKAQHSLFDGLLYGFAGDLALIFVAIILLMRNWSSGPLLMLPSVFPLVLVFGTMGLLGIVVDTGTVMAPAVALGVTVDDAIHFMLWCRRGQKQGMNRTDSIMFAYGDCAQAIYQSWAVIGLGLSAFAFSNFMPTRRFGILMLTMLTLSSIGNLVLLPALLAGPFGRWFWRIRKAAPQSEPDESSVPDEMPQRRPGTLRHRAPGDAVSIG